MRGFLKALAWIVGVVAVIVLVARLTVVRVWTIPDDNVLDASLAPTLAAGDVVLVLYRGERGFGDLVRCPDPEDGQRWVVGRIFGLQGDNVRIEGGVVSVNGKRYTTTESCADESRTVPHPVSGAPTQVGCARVELAGGWHFRGMVAGITESPEEHRVGPGRVYLVSDNISFHDDSRDFGAVPAQTCKEKVFFRLWGKEGFGDHRRRFEYVR